MKSHKEGTITKTKQPTTTITLTTQKLTQASDGKEDSEPIGNVAYTLIG